MRTESLEVFLTVAKENNITKAAALTHLSQPTVSRLIMDLEDELGYQLFVRTSKNVYLTKEGLKFQETAKDMLTMYKRALDVKNENDGIEGDIYFGAGEVGSVKKLAEYITDFSKLYSNVLIHLASGNAETICSEIEKGTLDIGLITRSVNTEQFEILELQEKERWGVFLRSDHALAKKETLQVKDLSEENLIVPENRIFYRELLNWVGDKAKIKATYTLVHNAIHLVNSGLGIMICFFDPALTSDTLKFVPLVPKREVTPMLVWKRKAIYPQAFELFLEYIQKTMTEQ